MKDILYTILGSIDGNSEEDLKNPKDEADKVIHNAIEKHGEKSGGAHLVKEVLKNEMKTFVIQGDNVSLIKLQKAVNKINRAIAFLS